MMKYHSFLFTASIWFLTALCVGVADADNVKKVTDADFFSGNVENALQELSNIDQSSNVFVKYFRDTIKQQSGSFDKHKKLIQDAVTKGTEMEKKIQNISSTLKSLKIPLPAELQSELEEIGKHAATELKKLEGVKDVNDIDKMQIKFKDKYEVFRGKLEALSKWGIELKKEEKEEKANYTQKYKENSEKLKTEGIQFIHLTTSFLFNAGKDFKKVSEKHEIASNALSMIRNDLIKVEQMEYHLLLLQKDQFKTDAASSIHSSLAQFVFAIMFGIVL